MLSTLKKKYWRPFLAWAAPALYPVSKLNLCAGSQSVNGYCAADLGPESDLMLDLAKRLLPFRDSSLDVVVCISAINYFTRTRAEEIIRDIHRALKPGGVARFAVQDMQAIAQRYVTGDREFFFQKLADGRERFEGATLGDKYAAWFYGYETAGGPCRYFFDFESLANLFRKSGFSVVERREFGSSRLPEVSQFDNRPDQMFFLEAVK